MLGTLALLRGDLQQTSVAFVIEARLPVRRIHEFPVPEPVLKEASGPARWEAPVVRVPAQCPNQPELVAGPREQVDQIQVF